MYIVFFIIYLVAHLLVSFCPFAGSDYGTFSVADCADHVEKRFERIIMMLDPPEPVGIELTAKQSHSRVLSPQRIRWTVVLRSGSMAGAQ